jgi:hypothetical protein
MAGDWWDRWVLWHAKLFGMNQEAIDTLHSWGEQWAAVYREDELVEASKRLHADANSSPYPDRQRAEIIRAVEQVRRRRTAAATRDAVDHPSGCDECGNTGFVVVPHPGRDQTTGGLAGMLPMPNRPTQPRYTLAVVCRCPRGSAVRAQDERLAADGKLKAPRLSLADYERRYPNWRAVQEAFDAQRPRRPVRVRRVSDLTDGIGSPPHGG